MQKEIKAAYIKLMKQYHPDTYSGNKLFAEQKAAEITEAYNNLKDEKLRKKHNANIIPKPQPKPEPKPKQPKPKKPSQFLTTMQTKWKEKFAQTNKEAMKYDIVIAIFIILLLIVIIIAL